MKNEMASGKPTAGLDLCRSILQPELNDTRASTVEVYVQRPVYVHTL